MLSERAQRSIEAIQEDERLRGDLEDSAAIALVEWASALATTIANDPNRSDSEVDAAVQSIRKAARSASRSGTNDPQQVVAAAKALTHQYADILAPTAAVSNQPSAISSVETPEQSNQPHASGLHTNEPATPEAAPAQQGLVRSLLERLTNPEPESP
ncbi:MAG: hypothetical protein SH847_05085 [Roseiflexaceae bacterium]|nr:hypothetical protein [Roseiflexaceae bacterium]